jgi:hypothetical protein
MASTYSPLKVELIGTGEQVATWGQTTNTNLGTAIEQAIGGKADVTMSSTSETLTLTDTNAAQNARALYLNLTGTPGGAATLNVPAVQKAYVVKNGTTGGFAVTVKVTGQTGVSVPNGATMHLYNNGTDVVNAVTNLPTGATVGGIAIGTGGGTVTSVTGAGTVNGLTLTGTVTSTGSLTLGGTLSNVNLASAVTGTLPVTNGGTGQTSITAGTLLLGNGGSAIAGLAGTINGQVPAWNSTASAWQASNTILLGNGTVTVPSLAATADTNTGIYFPAADKMAVATGGVEMMLFDSTKTVSPTTEYIAFKKPVWAPAPDVDGVLDVGRVSSVNGGSAISTIGGSTFLSLQIEDVEKARITDTGNVGIGLTNPTSRMHIFNSGADAYYSATSNSISCQLGASNVGQILFTGAPSSNFAIGTTNAKELSLATNGAVRLNIRSDGEVWVMNTSDRGAYNLQVGGTGVWGAGPYVDGSDERLKENIKDITAGLAIVQKIRPVSYTYRQDTGYTTDIRTHAGFIAQDLQSALDGQEYVEGVVQTGGEYLSVAYQSLIPVLTKAIQELKDELDAVKAELAAMKGN